MGAHPRAADVLAILEDFGHALADELNHRALRGVVVPANIGAEHDHVGVFRLRAGESVVVRRAVAIALVQAGHLVVFIGRDVGRVRGLVVDGDGGNVHAAVKAGLGELERVLGRFAGEQGGDGVHVDLNVVRRDVLAVVLAMEQIAVIALTALDKREHPAAFLARVGMNGERPVVHVNDDVIAVRPVLPAVEDPRAIPNLAQAAHRHTRGTDRTRVGRDRAHEEHGGAGGTVALNRHFIGNIGGSDAPVRQRFRVRVDVDEDRIIVAVPALTGQRIYAVDDRVFIRHIDGDLS